MSELLCHSIEKGVRRFRRVILEQIYYVRLKNLPPHCVPWEGSEYILLTKGIRNALVRGDLYFFSSVVNKERCCRGPRESLEKRSPGAPPSKPSYSNSKLQLPAACAHPKMVIPVECSWWSPSKDTSLSRGRVLRGGIHPEGNSFDHPRQR